MSNIENPLPTEELVNLIQESSLFGLVSRQNLFSLVEKCVTKNIAANEILFRKGDDGTSAYLVLDGKVQVRAPTDAGEVTVATLGKGNIFGEIAAFSNIPRTATVLSEQGARVLQLDQDSIRSLMLEDPNCSMRIIGKLGQTIERNNRSVAMMSLAANDLAEGEFHPEMLSALRAEAGRFAEFADVFEKMARELTSKEQLRQEMRTAKDIQESFLPGKLDLGSWATRVELAAKMIPAKQVGGDFYDYFMIDDETLGFVVGDVSGKGVPAAMFMSVSRTVLKTIARQGGNTAEVVAELNQLLSEDNRESMFVTLVFVRLNLKTGHLDYCSAGHEDAYFVTGTDGLVQVEVGGPAVGLIDGIPFQSHQRTITAGDFVVLGTDGISEAFDIDRRMFGREGFENLLAVSDATATATNHVERIIGQVQEFAGSAEQSDDITCLVVRLL